MRKSDRLRKMQYRLLLPNQIQFWLQFSSVSTQALIHTNHQREKLQGKGRKEEGWEKDFTLRLSGTFCPKYLSAFNLVFMMGPAE